jgi:hypothetical protein
MKLICPNCQKELTVPDEHAGQLMKCPLCEGNFTAPMLPHAAPPASGPVTPVPEQGPEIFKLAAEPAAPPLVTAAPPRKQEPPSSVSQPPPPPPPPVVLGPYEHRRSININPNVLQYVPPAAFFVIFVLSFFTWVGRYKGTAAIETQNGWQAAFGAYSIDSDVEKGSSEYVLLPKEKDSKEGPSFGWLTFFYGFFMLPTLLLTFGVVLLNFIPLNLPPPVQKLLPWRWAGVTALALMSFFMLALQTVVGFGLENAVQEKAKKQTPEAKASAEAQKNAEIKQGELAGNLQRTKAFHLVVLLHLAALVCAGLVFCGQLRPTKPVPRIDILW